MVEVHIMSESIIQCLECFETPVDGLVPRPQHCHCPFVLTVFGHVRGKSFVVATVPPIS